jgi:hypothetical protein
MRLYRQGQERLHLESLREGKGHVVAVRWRLVLGSGLIAVCIAFAFLNAWWYVDRLGEEGYYQSDVRHLYTAGKIIADGYGSRLYDFELQRRYQADMPQPLAELLPFNHPPFTAALIAPLARFPFLVLYLVFSLGQLAAYAFAIWMLRPWWGRWSRTEQIFFVSVALTFVCVFHAVHWGNPALFVFLFVALAFRYSHRNLDSAFSGIWLALSTIKPHTVIGLFWGFACGRRLRALFSAILTLAALLAFAIAVVGIEGTLDFGRATLWTYRVGEFGRFPLIPEEMPNFRGILALFGLSHVAVAIGTFVFILAVAFFLLWLWRPQPSNKTPANESLRWALTIPLGLLASPHLYGQDVSLTVLSGMLVYDAARNRPDQRTAIGDFLLVAAIASQVCFFVANIFRNQIIWSACNAIILIVLTSLALIVTMSVRKSSRQAGDGSVKRMEMKT